MNHSRLRTAALAASLCGLLPSTVCRAQQAAPPGGNLPVSRVALYTSGVGYFERSGQIDGNASQTLSFPIDQINDILKSLVLLDSGGGSILPVTFAAQDPLGKQLAAFSVDLSDNPDRATLLNRLRGASVHVVAGADIATGTIVGVETRTVQLPSSGGTLPSSILTLMCADGLRSIPLDGITSLQFLDPALDAEIRQALGALSQTRDKNKRAVTLNFEGRGRRQVTVGYVTQTPMWQASYRLVLGEKPVMQGWATVQNTSQDDWNSVHLSLVSGRPVSFIQDMYSPVYIDRPVVQPQIVGSPTPQTYSGNLQEDAAKASQAQDQSGSPALSGMRRAQTLPAFAPGQIAEQKGPSGDAGDGLSALSTVRTSVTAPSMADFLRHLSAATGEKLGLSLFAYDIATPISVPRQQSAMIPFLSAPVQARRVSIYNESVMVGHPLSGARMVNTSKLHLMGGPITVFDTAESLGSGYVGDAIIDDTEPGQTRLFSFAVDLAVDASAKQGPYQGLSESFAIVRGVLAIQSKTLSSTIYSFKNNATDSRLVVVEHPISGDDFKLVAPAKPDEKTASVYRFDVPIPAKASQALTVKEEQTNYQSFGLIDVNLPTVAIYLQNGEMSQPVKDALREVIRRRRDILLAQTQIANIDTQISAVTSGQERIRKNMIALDKSSPLYKRYVSELDAQETRLADLGNQRDALNSQLSRLRSDLSDYVSRLTVQ